MLLMLLMLLLTYAAGDANDAYHDGSYSSGSTTGLGLSTAALLLDAVAFAWAFQLDGQEIPLYAYLNRYFFMLDS